MTDPIDGIVSAFSRLSFDAEDGDGPIEMPVTRWGIKGGVRNALHEYPKVPGGQNEKLGRMPYRFHFLINAYTTQDDAARPYPNFYPSNLRVLIAKWEQEKTGIWTVPGRGQIRAKCLSWDSEFDAKIQCGEDVSIEVIEDSFDATAHGLLLPPVSGDLLVYKASALQIAAANDNIEIPITSRINTGYGLQEVQTGDIFSAISSLAGSIAAIQAEVDVAEQVIAARLETLIGYFEVLDRDPGMLDCRNDASFNALMEAWSAAVQMQRDVQNRGYPFRVTKTTRALTTIDQLSVDLYGTTERAVELLQLNAFNDGLAIPSGTSVNYYLASNTDAQAA